MYARPSVILFPHNSHRLLVLVLLDIVVPPCGHLENTRGVSQVLLVKFGFRRVAPVPFGCRHMDCLSSIGNDRNPGQLKGYTFGKEEDGDKKIATTTSDSDGQVKLDGVAPNDPER